MHLGQLGSLDAIEDDQRVLVVAVELRSLTELPRVLDRQFVDAEQLAELVEFLDRGIEQIEPEELVAGQPLLDLGVIRRFEELHIPIVPARADDAAISSPLILNLDVA